MEKQNIDSDILNHNIAEFLIQLDKAQPNFDTEFSNGYLAFDNFFNSIENREELLGRLMKTTQDLAQGIIKLYIKELEKKSEELTKKLNAPINPIKQQSFSSKEVQQITKIKSKDTVNKYLKNGIIKAHKDGRGQYITMREDLAAYLGHDNF